MPNTYENSERHFWDNLTRDAYRWRETITPLRDLIHALGATLNPPMDYFESRWSIDSKRFGRFESSSLAACLEWLTRAVEDEKQIAKEHAESKAQE